MNYPDIELRKAISSVQGPRSPAEIPDRCGGTTEGIVEQIEQAQRELDRLNQQAQEQAVRGRTVARIDNELALAEATSVLLTHIRQLVVDQVRTVNGSKALSRFIKELQPLAKTYGVKIVKVGNGELATLVLASAK